MNKKILYPMLFLLYLLTFYILANASINYLIYPFAFSLAFALVWCGQKVWIVAPSFLGASLLYNFTTQNIIVSVLTTAFLFFPFVFHIISKKKAKLWGQAMLVIFSQLPNLAFVYESVEKIIYLVITLIAGILFFLACVKVGSSIMSRGWAIRLTNLELVCGGLLIIAIADGLSTFSIGKFEFLKLFVSFVILASCFCSRRVVCIVMSCLLSFGTILPSGNTIFVAPILLWTLAVISFKSRKKIFSCLAILLAEAVCGFFFKFYYSFGIIEFLPVIISAFAFFILPNGWLDKIKDMYEAKNARLALKNVYNEGKELIGRRLEYLSNVFFEMNLVFKAMLKKSLSQDDIKNLLFKEVKKRVCDTCPEKARCHRTFCEDTTKSFEELITISFSKGKISLLDIPSFLNSRCGKVNLIISTVNSLCGQYKKYSEIMGTLDTSKLLIAEQLFGISNVIKGLSKDIAVNVSFDNVREEKIKDELCFNNIICSDAIVYDKDIHTKEVSIVVRNEDEGHSKIADIVSGVCDTKMLVANRNASITPGWTNLILRNAPKYDCVFGLATKTKTGSEFSGDSHSEIRLTENKFLFAVCDGMGSGQRAQETSNIAINLIENFYKAGFDNETILSSVNKLLVLEREENFSALDICVVDLSNGILDVIKMGSPSGYILSRNDVKIIEGGALPLGIVGESKPMIKKYIIDENEYVILMSDGISDSFASDRQLADCISRLGSSNPQTIADLIMEKALENNEGRAIDDMSVLVIKIFACQ